MSHNQKVAVFLAGVLGLAVALWGLKGITTILPGPNPN